MEFKKIVRYIGGKSCLLQYALSTGENTFLAGVDYEITNRKDFNRLVKSGVFEDVTPAPVVIPAKEEEEKVLVEDVPTPKRNKRDKEEVSN